MTTPKAYGAIPWDVASDAIINVRDAYPRKADDAPSDRVADAVIDALVEWHEREAAQADSATGRTLHLWAADRLRLPGRPDTDPSS